VYGKVARSDSMASLETPSDEVRWEVVVERKRRPADGGAAVIEAVVVVRTGEQVAGLEHVDLPGPSWEWTTNWKVKRRAGCNLEGWVPAQDDPSVRERVWQRMCTDRTTSLVKLANAVRLLEELASIVTPESDPLKKAALRKALESCKNLNSSLDPEEASTKQAMRDAIIKVKTCADKAIALGIEKATLAEANENASFKPSSLDEGGGLVPENCVLM